jgi:hypothetical protein
MLHLFAVSHISLVFTVNQFVSNVNPLCMYRGDLHTMIQMEIIIGNSKANAQQIFFQNEL